MALKKAVDKRIKEQERIKQSKERFKNFNYLTQEYLNRQKENIKRLIDSNYENPKERKLWQEYERIVKDSFETDNTKQKFSLSHVEALGVDYDILFLYSKKDVGKTWSVAKYIDDLLRRCPEAQVMFIRNSKEEAKGFITMMNDSSVWPTWTNGEYVWKKSDLKKYKNNLKKCVPCGFFSYATAFGFTRWQGGNFDRVKFWYWDECNTIQGGLTEEVFTRLNVLLSSIIRDKKEVKGIMTGNLLQKSNIFLERLGVGSHTRLKIFKVHKDNDKRKPVLSTLLYLNTGDMFKGIEEQEGLATQFLKSGEFEGLLSNRPGLLVSKPQYEAKDLKEFLPMYAFIQRVNKTETTTEIGRHTDYIIYVYKVPNSARICLWIDSFDPNEIKPGFKLILCNDRLIANKYTMTMFVEEKEDFGESCIEPIAEFLAIGELWYGWNGTEDLWDELWPRLESKYIKPDTTSV